VAKAYTMAAF